MPDYGLIRTEGIRVSFTRDNVAPGALTSNHCHDCFEILYVTEGRGRYIIEGNEYEMQSGTLLVIRPFQYHYVEVDGAVPYERYVIHFSTSQLPTSVQHLFAPPDGGDLTCTFFTRDNIPESVRVGFERFSIASELAGERRELYLSMLLSELLVLLSSARAVRPAPYNSELGARVIRYLNEHIHSDVSLDRIARHFFVSKYYLCRAFKKHNGISIHGYITQKRIMEAKVLIEAGESASGAAYRVGFGDYSAFYRAYIKVVGQPPVMSKSEKPERKENVVSDS